MKNAKSEIISRSREDYYILEKHSQDIFKMLLRNLLAIDRASEMLETERIKTERLLAEYFETKAALNT